jgi:hypothetical protein
MLKSAKILIILTIIVSGCVNKSTPKPLVVFPVNVTIGDPVGKIINSPVFSQAIAVNPLTFEMITSTENSLAVKMLVHGLKDKTIENKINADIQAIYERLLTYSLVPNVPYRGIQQLIPLKNYTTPKITFTPTFNFNNLLSIVALGSYSFANKPGDERERTEVTVVETLNYDLTSGRLLTIADLFTNDADIEGLLNPKVEELIRKTSSEYMDADTYIYGYPMLEQVSPFKGIQGDQVFALSEAGLQLFFDYRTPAFNTMAKAFQFDIPLYELRPYLAADRRFLSDASIYLSSVKEHRFLYDVNPILLSEQKQVSIDGHVWSFSMRYPEGIDAFYLNRMKLLQGAAEPWISSLHLASIDYASRYLYAHNLGNFTMIDIYTSLSSAVWGVYFQEHECYNATKKLIQLDDLFVEGFDFENFIRPKIEKQISYFDAGLRLGEKYDVFRSHLSFTLSETAVILDTYAFSLPDNIPYAIQIYLSYEEIGSENMTIFD